MQMTWSPIWTLVVVFLSLGAVHEAQGRRAVMEDIFADLSVTELNQITEFLYKQDPLNLVNDRIPKVSDSYIFLVEALRPNKADALRYLDEDGPAPKRVAKVTIFRGDLVTPEIQEYNVFPIPNPTTYERTKNPTWKDPIPFHSRSPINGPELVLIDAKLVGELTKIASIISEVADGYTLLRNCTKCLRWVPALPATSESNQRKMTLYLVRAIEGGYLYPIGLQVLLTFESVDETDWFIENVWFQGQRFGSLEEMVDAENTGTLYKQILREPDDIGKKTLSSSMNFRGTPRPSAKKRGPASYMPDGDRFEINGRRVSWLGWEFNYAMLTSTGLQLHDVRFLGERIAYEIALQELAVFYSGGSPGPRHTSYFDSYTIFGTMTSQLFPGIDCPQHAKFFDFTHYMHGIPHVYKNGACLFELDRGVPLRRHYESNHQGGYFFAQGMPDVVLVFRQVMSPGNYDYIFDVMFHQGGQIEVKVSLSGYVLSTYYTNDEMNKYGHRMNDANAIGNIHHHLAHFKVDLDIKGTRNRFETLDIKLEDVDDSLTPGYTLKNRYVERSMKETENAATYQYNFDTPKYLIMYNENEKNKYGNHRGYRIVSEAMSKMLLPDSYRGVRSRSWTRYQVAVTKFKETERTSSSMYTAMEVLDPPMSFEDFIGDERIVDEDLVAWVTVGSHHIPHTEDVPVVTTPGVQLTFFLIPYNYFDEDPSLASRDNIRVTPGFGGYPMYEYAGSPPPLTHDVNSAAHPTTPPYLTTILLISFSAPMLRVFQS